MTTIETKIAKNGTKMYYVGCKRVSRESAIETATANREGKTFTVVFSAYNSTVGEYVNDNTVNVDALAIKVQQEAHKFDMGFRVIVNNRYVAFTCGYKTDADAVKKAKADANAIADAVVAAYINCERGVKIDAGIVEALPAIVETANVEDPAAEYAATIVAPAKVLALPAPAVKKANVEVKTVELPSVIYLPAPAAEKVNVEVKAEPVILTPAQIAAAEIVNSLGNVIVKFAHVGEGKNGGLALHYETFNSVGDEFPTDTAIVEVFAPKSYILDHVNVIKGYGDDKQIVTHLFKDYYTAEPTPAPVKVNLPSELPPIDTEKITVATVTDAWKIITQRFSGKFTPGEVCECWDGTATAVFHNGDLRLEVFSVDGHNVMFDVKRNDVRPFLHIDIDANANPPAEPDYGLFTKEDFDVFKRSLACIYDDLTGRLNAKAPAGWKVTYQINVTPDPDYGFNHEVPHFVSFNGETVAEPPKLLVDKKKKKCYNNQWR